MVIDFHTHAFTDRIAEGAIRSLRKTAALRPHTDGTVAGLKHAMAELNITKGVLLNIATKPEQQRIINNWAAEISCDEIIAFGSVHPDAQNCMEEVERIKDLGLPGIKLHPDYQDFFVDDPKVLPLYQKIGELGLITVFHAGMDIGLFEPVHCTPGRLRRALPAFGGAPVVAAHFGGFLMWQDVEQYLVGEDVYLDTAYSYGRIPPPQAARIVKNHGADRILFGSDMPWSSIQDELMLMDHIGLSETEKENVLYGNAARILGL